MKKRALFLWSCIIPLLSLLWVTQVDDQIFKLGFPLKFVTYHNFTVPDGPFQIFNNFFLTTSIDLGIYIFNALLTYGMLTILIKLTTQIRSHYF